MEFCKKHDMVFVKRVMSNGNWLINKQCLECGEHDSFAYKHTLVVINETPFFNDVLKNTFWQRKREYKTAEREKLKKELILESKDYYRSDKWRNLRQEVIEREQGYCFFCYNIGTDVHHIHYNNWQNESINDLILVCRPCHNKLHLICPELGIIKQKLKQLL